MVGIGYDLHRLESGNTLILGGVNIPCDKGTVAHSDGDVLIHSIIDALLGAASLGDIGEHFPDTDKQYEDVDSGVLLSNVRKMLEENNFKIINIDATIILESPKLSEYKLAMRKNIAKILGLDIQQINVKATTNERLDSVGENQAIAVLSVCELERK